MSQPGPLLVALLAVAVAVALVASSSSVEVTLGVVALVVLAMGAWWAGERRHRHALLARLGRTGEGAGWEALEAAVDAAVLERDRAAAELARIEPWRSRLVSSIEGPALLFSDDERLVAANEAARTLLGIPEPRSDVMLVQALGSATLSTAVREAQALGRPVQVDAEVRGRDLRATVSAVADEILVIVADRTEQRRVEELRRNFVVNASHELKTPATAIQALTEALQVAIGSSSPRVPDLVERLGEESDRLIRMVHDLLDLRRLEEPGPLERVPVDLVALVQDVLADEHPGAEEVGVELEAELPASAHIAGVPEDVALVVHNLVSNAIRYNRPGGCVTVRLVRDAGDHVLSVQDTGIGIPRRDLQRVFERFYRVDVARSRERGGTGLGLSLVRHAVERHGGSGDVDSLLGTGTTFTVRLPIEPVD